MASPALARPDECVRALYESCTNSDMVGGAGRFMSGQVGLCRIMSGQGGQYSFSWTFALGFAHVSTLSWLGTGQLPVLEGSSPAFGFAASVSHGLVMTVRSQ